MWLLPVFSPIARSALHAFYRFRREGEDVPRTGPVLLVANHPNSLLDPAAVVAVAGRPVRFLAKASLFSDPLVGWLIRASGSIPVYRRQDVPSLAGQNDDTFRAAHAALRGGDALGIFPEGLSHSEPSLAPLRTGAARIALGAVAAAGSAFPIVPIGLVFHEKQRFRSSAACIVGAPVAWDDLCARGEADAEAVRELTRRIELGLREVTINLERREDAAIVLRAEEIFNAERGVKVPERERVQALREVTLELARLRGGGEGEWLKVARAVGAHGRKLEVLGMRPDQLAQPGGRAALIWTLRQTLLLAVLFLPGVAGMIVYAPSFRLTDLVAHRSAPSPDTEATYKLLVGIVAHVSWTLLVSLGVAAWLNASAGFATALILPVLGWAAVRFRERWSAAWATARQYLVRERREGLMDALRREQRELAARLGELRDADR